MASSKRRLTRNKLIIASVSAVFLIPALHGVFFRKGKLAQAPVFGICSDATAGASEGIGQLGSVVRPPPVRIDTCPGGKLGAGGPGVDLEVTGYCEVDGKVPNGEYLYRDVNIYEKNGNKGKLTFDDAVINFHAESILVENGGSLIAGADSKGKPTIPIGMNGGNLAIYLYGNDQGAGGVGIVCKSDPVTCGIPSDIWNTDRFNKVPLGNGVTDYFYPYKVLPFDYGTDNGRVGYFGYKVLAVSFGGTLQLFGKKGAVYPPDEDKLGIKDPGRSWSRLAGTILAGATKLNVETTVPIDWQIGDHIVVTTTDYLADHSEELVIDGVGGSKCKDDGTCTTDITFKTACSVGQDPITPMDQCKTPGVRWTHNGVQFNLGRLPERLKITKKTAETRAAVALLTRSIRVVSEGDDAMKPFPVAPKPSDQNPVYYYFGGHTIARQGFKLFQMQGVEFDQLGEGGRLGHYPVHFHMAREVPADTFVKDCSVSESMTRWYVIHGTQKVTLQRNVGYLSIGHGYYMEDADETDNNLYANIGIFARAAVANAQNPRQVPGILASPASSPFNTAPSDSVIYDSDKATPAVFWITNGWNEFVGNMAAGAGLCGLCFWEPPANNGGSSGSQQWESYASEQTYQDPQRAGLSPLKRFDGNFCTSAMTSFQSVGYTVGCPGVGSTVQPVKNDYATGGGEYCENDKGTQCGNYGQDNNCVFNPNLVCKDAYYPALDTGQSNQATQCPDPGKKCTALCQASDEKDCMVSIINDYTTSFTYAPYNFAAMWLRRRWYLVSNSFISDVQNAGLSFLSGGDYATSSAITGLWDLALKTTFVGESQPADKDHAYASVLSPFNDDTKNEIKCDNSNPDSYCMSKDNGFVLGPFAAFGNYEHMFSIYDGPQDQDSNAYLDIKKTDLGDNADKSIYHTLIGIPKDSKTKHCYIPNAAIGWKTPNGFYYPPTFHSGNLFFDNVDIRHYVIVPFFNPGTYTTAPDQAKARYCTQNANLFQGFTDIDRQTFLTDDDGSLTGYAGTSSLNEDAYFAAPIEGPECGSNDSVPEGATARTVPYHYVTTVVFPECQLTNTCGSNWAKDCATPNCFGVPLYREYLTGTEDSMKMPPPPIKMAATDLGQREALTLNHVKYYIDTTVSEDKQKGGETFSNLNVFEKNMTYNVFLVFAKPDTEQTYSFYFGPNLDKQKAEAAVMLIRVEVPSSFIITPGNGDSTTLKATYNDPFMTVTVNQSFFKKDYESATKNECVPQSFCKWDDTNSKCKGRDDLLPSDPGSMLTQAERDRTCSHAGQDITCPTGGCIGFQFTLPESFKTVDLTPPPASCFVLATWDMMLDPCGAVTSTSPPCVAPKDLAGECYKAPINKNFCGMSFGPADMSANSMETAALSSDCASTQKRINGPDGHKARPATDAVADTGGAVSEARFLDDLSSR